MSKNLIALILAAGLAALAYQFIGRRLGYSGNSSRVWIMVASVFVAGYLVLITAFTWLVHF